MKKCHHMGSEEKNSGVLLAILGRGIQHPSPESTVWELTPDIELCDEKGAHLPFRAPENDDDPRSIIGGGQLNVLAGTILIDRLRPTLVVCAYGARSKYLNSIGAPSESEIMTSLLSNEVGKQKEIMPATDVFDEAAWHGISKTWRSSLSPSISPARRLWRNSTSSGNLRSRTSS